ncbi:MAG: capsid assembly scaffolding protein Gp46 family protein [Cetobacterium sp.]
MINEEQKEFLKSEDGQVLLKEIGLIKDVTDDTVSEYLNTSEKGRKLANSMYDKEYDRRFKKWQIEKYPTLLDEEIKKRTTVSEDPRDKIIKEMREGQEKFQREIRTKDNKNFAMIEANKHGIPNEFLDFIVSESEEVTKENFNKISAVFKTHVDLLVQKKIEERLGGAYKPAGQGGKEIKTSEYEKAKKNGNSLDMLDFKLRNLN